MKKKTPVNNETKPVKERTEKDLDDLVHSQPGEVPGELGEADPDDRVHQPVKKKLGNVDESLADPDDLIHEDEEEPERE